jgi:membrane-associated phospholipid phosphatase
MRASAASARRAYSARAGLVDQFGGKRYTPGVSAGKHVTALALGAVMALAGIGPRPSRAQEEPAAGYDVSLAVDGAVTGGLVAGTLLLSLWPVDTSKRWSSELFGPLDDRVKNNFSDRAAMLSDAALVVTMVAPVLLALPGGWNRDTGRHLLLHGQAISANVFVQSLTKYLVQRPRPYNYHSDPRVAELAREAGKDSHASFYSGHASTAFAAAVSGSYLFASGGADREIKAMVWLFEMTLASTTTQLRARAGRHFYSDVLTGAVVGSAIGFLVPAFHADERGLYRPSGLEWMALAGGVVLGTATAHLLPLESDIRVPLIPASTRLVPMANEHGTGIALAGWF